MDVRVREAEDEDVPALEIIRRQAVEHGFTEAYDRADIAERVASPDTNLPDWIDDDGYAVVVIESEVTVLAYGVFDRTEGVIRGIYTAPAYEREGWGSRVLERFEELARDERFDSIEASVPRNAVPFFAANGFERVGEGDSEGLSIVEMEKPLD